MSGATALAERIDRMPIACFQPPEPHNLHRCEGRRQEHG
jgi:hypothetical protein